VIRKRRLCSLFSAHPSSLGEFSRTFGSVDEALAVAAPNNATCLNIHIHRTLPRRIIYIPPLARPHEYRLFLATFRDDSKPFSYRGCEATFSGSSMPHRIKRMSCGFTVIESPKLAMRSGRSQENFLIRKLQNGTPAITDNWQVQRSVIIGTV